MTSRDMLEEITGNNECETDLDIRADGWMAKIRKICFKMSRIQKVNEEDLKKMHTRKIYHL
jgi:hypothetical protein